ncbi:MAG: methyltransferase domain-containing protein [Paucibacter sp.]|nr:methyltransferase domain-containing protein [Roseateles sp.]
MNTLPEVHLCIVQPSSYVHSLGFIDQARYFRYQFRRLGARVSIAKNRLRHDAVNLIFGAHLGFDVTQTQRHACVFVQLEQIGRGGANLRPDYLKLLQQAAVIDYDADNVPAYSGTPQDVPLVAFQHAPYLKLEPVIPLEERPIDLLFIGSMNDRRRAWLDRVEACGRSVAVFDAALYAEERDDFIRQAKAVVNCHFYESARFEQARVAQCLSLGTPVISERTEQTRPHAAFEDCVLWLQDHQLERFFREDFATPAFYEYARAALQRFEAADPIEAYADALAFVAGYARVHHQHRPTEPWRPERVNLGSGRDYKTGWLNIDILDRAMPDVVLDLSAPLQMPLRIDSARAGPVELAEDSVALIYANNVLEHVPDLASLMGNCLRLLRVGGEFQIEVPYERALSAWQDPTHVRAMNENSWIYYTAWFWYLGWFEHRFDLVQLVWLDSQLQACNQSEAAFMRVTLRKIVTTPRERTTARTMQAELRLPDDDLV